MSNSRDNIKDLYQAQLDIYRDIKGLLTKIINHEQGTVWACEQVDKINSYFCQLKKLDAKINNIKSIQIDYNHNTGLIDLRADLQNSMLNVKNLLGVFQARISGGQQHISNELKKVVKNMEIKGYQERGYLKSKNVACVY